MPEKSAFEDDPEEEKKEEEATPPIYQLVDAAGNNMLSEVEAGEEQSAFASDGGTPVARNQHVIAEQARCDAFVRAAVLLDISPPDSIVESVGPMVDSDADSAGPNLY